MVHPEHPTTPPSKPTPTTPPRLSRTTSQLLPSLEPSPLELSTLSQFTGLPPPEIDEYELELMASGEPIVEISYDSLPFRSTCPWPTEFCTVCNGFLGSNPSDRSEEDAAWVYVPPCGHPQDYHVECATLLPEIFRTTCYRCAVTFDPDTANIDRSECFHQPVEVVDYGDPDSDGETVANNEEAEEADVVESDDSVN